MIPRRRKSHNTLHYRQFNATQEYRLTATRALSLGYVTSGMTVEADITVIENEFWRFVGPAVFKREPENWQTDPLRHSPDLVDKLCKARKTYDALRRGEHITSADREHTIATFYMVADAYTTWGRK